LKPLQFDEVVQKQNQQNQQQQQQQQGEITPETSPDYKKSKLDFETIECDRQPSLNLDDNSAPQQYTNINNDSDRETSMAIPMNYPEQQRAEQQLGNVRDRAVSRDPSINQRRAHSLNIVMSEQRAQSINLIPQQQQFRQEDREQAVSPTHSDRGTNHHDQQQQQQQHNHGRRANAVSPTRDAHEEMPITPPQQRGGQLQLSSDFTQGSQESPAIESPEEERRKFELKYGDHYGAGEDDDDDENNKNEKISEKKPNEEIGEENSKQLISNEDLYSFIFPFLQNLFLYQKIYKVISFLYNEKIQQYKMGNSHFNITSSLSVMCFGEEISSGFFATGSERSLRSSSDHVGRFAHVGNQRNTTTSNHFTEEGNDNNDIPSKMINKTVINESTNNSIITNQTSVHTEQQVSFIFYFHHQQFRKFLFRPCFIFKSTFISLPKSVS